MKQTKLWLIEGQQYPFRHTNGIKPDVKDYPPALSEK